MFFEKHGHIWHHSGACECFLKSVNMFGFIMVHVMLLICENVWHHSGVCDG